MAHLNDVICDVERYSIEDVIAAAEKSLEPCDCTEDMRVAASLYGMIELSVADRLEPVRRLCTLCGRDVA